MNSGIVKLREATVIAMRLMAPQRRMPITAETSAL
jgi:hypothetical protein